MTNRLAYGDGVASLEAAALAVGRLDAALLVIRRYRPGRSGASSTRRAVMPRRMADGLISIGSPRSRTACRSGAVPPCPWPSGGDDIAAPAHTVELCSWIVQSDPGQQDLLDRGFAHLRQARPQSAPPCPFTSGQRCHAPAAGTADRQQCVEWHRAGHDRLFPIGHQRRAAHHP
jgi:hypothetical protein